MPVAIAALLFIGCWRRWSQFGLAAWDDAPHFSHFNWSWPEVWKYVWFCLARWPFGRPVGYALLSLVSYVVFQLGGLHGLFLVAFAVKVVNALLLHRLVRRACNPTAAFAAAVFYGLSPAHTVQAELWCTYHYELSLTAGLLATNFALDRRRILFAASLAVAFTMAEPATTYSLCVPPLLVFRWNKEWRTQTMWHVAIWIGVVASLLIARYVIGDPWGNERVAQLAAHPLVMLHHAIKSAGTGFATYASLFCERLLLPLKEADRIIGWLVVTSALLALGAFAWLQWRAAHSTTNATGKNIAPKRDAAILVAAGVLATLAAYFIYFRKPWYPASWRWGFMSAVHLFPAPGAALLLAGVVQWAIAIVPAKLRWMPLLVSASVIGLLCGFGDLVQREHAATWQIQKEFWRAYRRLCRDATAGTFVLVLDRNLPTPRFVETFGWETEVLPQFLFVYPDVAEGGIDPLYRPHFGPYLGRRAPVVVFTAPDPASTIRYERGSYRWKEPAHTRTASSSGAYRMQPKDEHQQPRDGDVILLERQPDGWHRIEGVITVDGGKLALRPARGDLLDHLPMTNLARVYDL